MTPYDPGQPGHLVIGVDEEYRIGDRVAGQVVLRRTYARGREINSPCPCHDREYVTFPPGPATLTVVCRTCLLAYTVTLQHPAGRPPETRWTQKDLRVHLTRRRMP